MILTEKPTQEFNTLYQNLTEQEDLQPKVRLAQYYDTVRQRFGPGKIRNNRAVNKLLACRAGTQQDIW